MENNFTRKIRQSIRRSRRRRLLAAVVALISAVVVLGVTVSLMQPVITMTTICGREEHAHSDACYSLRLICGQDGDGEHVHGDACYERVLSCSLSEHTHTDACYPAPTGAPTAAPTEAPTAAPTEAPAVPPPAATLEPATHGSGLQGGAYSGSVPPPAATLDPSIYGNGSQGGSHSGSVPPPAATLAPGAAQGPADGGVWWDRFLTTPVPSATMAPDGEPIVFNDDEGDDDSGPVRIRMSANTDVTLLGQSIVWQFEATSEQKFSLSWQLLRDGMEVEKGDVLTGQRSYVYTPNQEGRYALRLTATVLREDGTAGETKSRSLTVRAVELLELAVSVRAGARSCFGGDYLRFALTRSGNEFAEAAEASVTVWQDGAIIYESAEFSDVVAVTPAEMDHACTVRLTVTLKDRFEQTAEASVEVPCAMHERENSFAWEQTMQGAALTGVWPEDLLTIARTQLGYRESELDFIIDEEGDRQGWTRYGAWYGMPYEEWCSMYVSFCLNYARVPEWAVPRSASQQRLLNRLKEKGLYAAREEAEPRPGDLVFFDHELEGEEGYGATDHIGIVTSVEDEWVHTIEGNSAMQVREREYLLADEHITGYGLVNRAYEAAQSREERSADPTPAADAAIEVLAGSVPEGAAVSYDRLSRADAAALAAAWLDDGAEPEQEERRGGAARRATRRLSLAS